MSAALDERGVGERTEDVEDRAKTERPPDGRQVSERVVKRRGEQEADARALDAGPDDLLGRVQAHPERFEHVGRTHRGRRRPVAVLGDPHAAARDGERRHGRDVHRVQLVAAGADDVDRLGTDSEGGRRRRSWRR